MIIEKTAGQLVPGDVLSGNGATVETVVPCEHGASTYVEYRFGDGALRRGTVPAGRVIPVWVKDGKGAEDESLAQDALRDMGVTNTQPEGGIMPVQSVRAEMPNGVSVADWLGTAALAARGASIGCEACRSEGWVSEDVLRRAADDAAQALQEITAVMDHYGWAHGYGAACSFGEES